MRTTRELREIVLVGGGHSHVQVLRSFAMEPPPYAHLTLVLDVPLAIYSGMVPGLVAGRYTAQELEIDCVPLARRAGARVILSPATGVDARNRRVLLKDRPPISYDIASFDTGSTVGGLNLPGVREHALPTRPIGLFVRRMDAFLEKARRHPSGKALRAVVVGAGAGGVELAFTLERRLRTELAAGVEVRLLEAGERILPGAAPSLVRRIETQAEKRSIGVECGRKVVSVSADHLALEGGVELPCDLLVWVTGAVSTSLFADSGLATDPRGFVLTRKTLQVRDYDDLFAVGDCASQIDYPRTPKAGVYAVRQGPYLTDNLRASLAGDRLREYRPQSDFLTLLNLGDGRAVGSKWGLTFEGRWVMGLKDRIDRRFMRRFQVLGPDGHPSAEFEAMGTMDGETEGMPMLCGGCAAKLGQSVLDRALERLEPGPKDETVRLGLEHADDAAAYAVGAGDHRPVVVSSIDAFRAFTDDPYLLGRVAAVNAVSDLQAKGVRPRYAQALVALPQDRADETNEESLVQILAGARTVLDLLGVTLLGGHTLTAADALVGFHVEGIVASETELLGIDRLEPGQELILTKALGTGVLFHADMKGMARGSWIGEALESMQRHNGVAAEAAVAHHATAATDVTGFGLAGHLAEMSRASGVTAIVDIDTLPALGGALELMARDERSTSHEQNAKAKKGMRIADGAGSHPKLPLLFDPQTAGGLLFGVPTAERDACLTALRKAGETATCIGQVVKRPADGAPIEVRAASTL
ncbi:MAG: selenide, water dikinase SelD [Acidobacteriota bacterium]|nr:selenide, water dikinase SelD [Acidobacteriota bacterium]